MRTETATTKVYVDSKDAEAAISDLRKEATGLRRELKLAQKSGDKEAFLGLSKSLDENKRKMSELKNATFVYDNVVKNLSRSTLKELERAQKSIARELTTMTRGTVEFTEKSRLLSKVRAEISATKAEMNQFSATQKGAFKFNMAGAVDGFNKYFGVVAGGFAALTGIVMSFRSTINDFNEFQQKGAELSSLTGLKGDELEYLKDQAKELSTTTTESGVRITASAADILEAFKLMGGAKAELLQNKEALAAVTREALILAETSEMTAQQAVEAVANTMNQFGAGAEQASRYVNVLAAGASAGAAEVDDLSASMVKAGTAANMSNLSVEETVALLETLAEKGVKAQIAGTQLKSVILKLNAGADQYNPKVVGMTKALENLANANLSTAERVEMFGLESVTAASILIDNREAYQNLKQEVTGTSEAYLQAANNTDTNTAALKQAQNMVKLNSIELGERLEPHLTTSTNLFAKMLTTIIRFVDWIERNRNGLIMLGKALGILLTAAGAYWATMKGISLLEKTSLFLTQAQTAATHAFALAKSLLTGKINSATMAQKRFIVAARANPYGAIISVIMAAASAFLMFSEDIDEVTNSQAELEAQLAESNKRIAEQKNLLDQTREVIHKMLGKDADLSSMSVSELNSALTDIEERMNAISQKDFDFTIKNETLGIYITDKGSEAEKKKRYEEEQKRLANIAAMIRKEIELRNKKNQIPSSGQTDNENEKKRIKDQLQLLAEWERKVFSSMLATEKALQNKNERELDDIRERYNEEILFAEQQAKKDVANKEAWLRVSDELILQRNDELNQKRKEQESAFQEQLKQIRKQYGIASQEELMQEEIETIQNLYKSKLLTTEEAEKLIAEIKEKYRLKQLEEENALQKLIQDTRDKWLGVSVTQQFNRELEELKSAYEKKLLTTEEYEAAIHLLKKKYSEMNAKTSKDEVNAKIQQYTTYFQEVSNILGALGEFVSSQKEAEVQAAGDSEARKKQIAKKYADTEMAIKIAAITASTAAALMQAFAQLGPIAGAIAAVGIGITGGVQISNAVRERNRIKGFKRGFYPVTDQSGNSYNATFGGTARTGIVDRPSVFLAGESGASFPEMIIDGPTFRNIQMNAPEAIDAIYRNRAGQDNGASNNAPKNDAKENMQSKLFSAIYLTLEKLNSQLDKGIRSKIYKRDIDDLYNEMNEIEEDFG